MKSFLKKKEEFPYGCCMYCLVYVNVYTVSCCFILFVLKLHLDDCSMRIACYMKPRLRMLNMHNLWFTGLESDSLFYILDNTEVQHFPVWKSTNLSSDVHDLISLDNITARQVIWWAVILLKKSQYYNSYSIVWYKNVY